MQQHRDAVTDQRWRLPADICAVVRRRPGLTHADLVEELGLEPKVVTEALTRLTRADLLETVQETPGRKGRPAAKIIPHPRGPVVAAVEITAQGWRVGVAGFDGIPLERIEQDHEDPNPARVVETLTRTLVWCHETYGYRLRATSLSIAATIRGTVVTQWSGLPWEQVDLAPIRPPHSMFLVASDGTLAALAEARRGPARGHRTALHLLVRAGIGGGLTVGGHPFVGAFGAALEVGHLPFGDPRISCDCGATGCWNTVVSGPALAEQLGVEDPSLDAIARAIRTAHRDNRSAVKSSAWSLGRGLGGLISTTDPDVITVAGLAPALLDAAPGHFDEGLRSATMRHRQTALPPILPSELGEDGSFLGAIDSGLDRLTQPKHLARWAETR